MNLDDLKETWTQQTIDKTPEVSLSEQNKLKSPLAIIRKNMLKEFWTSAILIFLVVFGTIIIVENTKLLTYTMSLLFVVILIMSYYFWKFKKLYKEIENHNYSTFQSLLELNYNLKYYTDLYVSYYVAFVPILLCEFFLIYEFNSFYSSLPITSFIPITLASIFFALFALYFLGKWFFDYYYGRYITKIANLLREIKHPYENFENQIIKVEEKDYWFKKTERFFINKIGKVGLWLNIILWIAIFLLVTFIIGYLVGYFGALLGSL